MCFFDLVHVTRKDCECDTKDGLLKEIPFSTRKHSEYFKNLESTNDSGSKSRGIERVREDSCGGAFGGTGVSEYEGTCIKKPPVLNV